MTPELKKKINLYEVDDMDYEDDEVEDLKLEDMDSDSELELKDDFGADEDDGSEVESD